MVLTVLKRYRPHVKMALHRLGVHRPSRKWVLTEDNPAEPTVLPRFRLYGLIVTWMEADVIEATVRNAFVQGCDRVFLVDNDSPDDTVARATAAGAELAKSYVTEQHDERLKIDILNQTVARLSAEADDEHIWWMWLDADEFLHGPGGSTVREHLTGLDRRFRAVGSRYFNHYPDRKPEAEPGCHPLDFQPLCEELPGTFCAVGHRKHHLQRFDRGAPPITSMIGFHALECAEPLIEPSQGLFTHHFPYRAEEATRARCEALCGRGNGAEAARIDLRNQQERQDGGHIADVAKRFRTLDRVYAQQWDAVENLRRRGRTVGVNPLPWSDLVDPRDRDSARWYPTGSTVDAG
jgi:hypothetical protein